MAFPTGYLKYQELTIDHTKVAADLTDYIVYVNLADLVKTGADIFDTCRTDGGDIRATKTDGTTELAVEVVAIDTTAKTGEIHVKFSGTLSSSTDTVIRIWYNGTDTLPAVTDTYGRNAVWSGFRGVWHLQTNSNDSTGNYNGTDTSTTYNSSNGKVGNGLAASSSKIDFSTMGGNGSVARSFSVWLKTTANSGGIFSYGNVTTNNYFAFSMGSTGSNNGRLDCGNWNGNGVVASGDAVNDGNWHRVSVTYVAGGQFNSTNIKLYKDGVAISASGGSNQVLATTDANYGLAYWRATNSFHTTGSLDEARFSLNTLSANWLLTEYNNQNSPSTFYSAGAEIGGSTIVSPAVQALTFSLLQETITAGAVLPVNAQAITFSIPAYAVSGKALVSVNAQTATFSIPTYLLIANGISLSPDAQALTFSIPTYSVLSGVTLDVGVSTLTFSVPTANITGGASLSVNTQSLTFTIPTLAFIGALWRRSARATSGADWTRAAINND